jgi:aryl-alcohol dehydrogenase-like predicted oxidoreductase
MRMGPSFSRASSTRSASQFFRPSTAPKAQAERAVGDTLRDQPRGEWVLSTKIGRLLRPMPRPSAELKRRHPLPFEVVYDYSHDGIMRSFGDSLQRLGLTLDISMSTTSAPTSTAPPHPSTARGISIVVGGPFNSGILAGRDTLNYDTAPPEIAAKAKAMVRSANATACRCRRQRCSFRWPTRPSPQSSRGRATSRNLPTG